MLVVNESTDGVGGLIVGVRVGVFALVRRKLVSAEALGVISVVTFGSSIRPVVRVTRGYGVGELLRLLRDSISIVQPTTQMSITTAIVNAKISGRQSNSAMSRKIPQYPTHVTYPTL
jgi:hypothetical protein